MLRDLPSLSNDERYISYGVVSLFTNIPLNATVQNIYVNGKMKPNCSKVIFKRLLCKLTTECTFFKQIDCALLFQISISLGQKTI